MRAELTEDNVITVTATKEEYDRWVGKRYTQFLLKIEQPDVELNEDNEMELYTW